MSQRKSLRWSGLRTAALQALALSCGCGGDTFESSLEPGLRADASLTGASGADAQAARATQMDAWIGAYDAATADASDASTAAPTPAGDDAGVTAIAASEFLDSLGICTHVAQGVDDPSKSANAMAYAGIRNLRDDGLPTAVPGWLSMHELAGVRVCMLPNGDLPTTLDMAKQLQDAGALLAVEGPNEPNNFPVTYQGQTSSATSFLPVARFQKDLYAAVKAEPSLQKVPVFHSSEAGGSEPDNVGLQFLTIPQGAKLTMPDGTVYADYANVHNYICGHQKKLVDNVAWSASDPTLNGDWDSFYVEYGHTWSKGYAGYSNDQLNSLPRVSTETGWVTEGTGAITREQQGRLFLNLYLSAFARGVAYTFIYMLRDDPSQGSWGLFDSAYQPKQAATYLHNLTSILADTQRAATGKLDFALENPPSTVHSLLLQKSDGTFALVVWNERPAGGTDNVGVDLKRPRTQVTAFDPTTGETPFATQQEVQNLTLILSDHPVVLLISAS